jgi:hypothetical protein
MKFFTRTLMTAVLILACGLVVSAQKQESATEEARDKQKVEISREYDKSDNQTTLGIGSLPITCVQDSCIFLSMHASFSGKQIKAPVERFIFGLHFFSKRSKPFENEKLLLRVDDETLNVGEMTYVGMQSRDGIHGLAYGIPLTREEVTKIVNARKVEMGMENLKFSLGENQLKAIRELYRQASPAKD